MRKRRTRRLKPSSRTKKAKAETGPANPTHEGAFSQKGDTEVTDVTCTLGSAPSAVSNIKSEREIARRKMAKLGKKALARFEKKECDSHGNGKTDAACRSRIERGRTRNSR